MYVRFIFIFFIRETIYLCLVIAMYTLPLSLSLSLSLHAHAQQISSISTSPPLRGPRSDRSVRLNSSLSISKQIPVNAAS